jgi:hypothetical protein
MPLYAISFMQLHKEKSSILVIVCYFYLAVKTYFMNYLGIFFHIAAAAIFLPFSPPPAALAT